MGHKFLEQLKATQTTHWLNCLQLFTSETKVKKILSWINIDGNGLVSDNLNSNEPCFVIPYHV